MLCEQQKILLLTVDSPLKVLDLQSGLSKELLTGSWHLHNYLLQYFKTWPLETDTVRSKIWEWDALDTNYLYAHSSSDSSVFFCYVC